MPNALLLLFVIVMLMGCSSPESLLSDYNKRLERVLKADIATTNRVQTLPEFPSQRDLLLTPPSVDLTLLEAWSTRHCTLFSLIGERNAILGKLSEPEIRLDYEARLLTELQHCADHPETSDALRGLLLGALYSKQESYWQTAWNATFANPDFNATFSLSERTLPLEPLDLGGYNDGLIALENMVLAPQRLQLPVLLNITQRHQQYALGGSTLKALRLSINELTQATARLEAATEAKTLCPNDRPRETLTIAQTVMVKIFIGEVQPWLVEINRAYLTAFPTSQAILDRFEAQHSHEAFKAVTEYLAEAEALHQNQQTVIRNHVKAWQALFAACNISVGLGGTD